MVAECLIWTSNEYIYCASQAGWLSLFSHLFILGYGCCVGTDFPPQWHSPYHKQRHLQMFCISSRYFSIPFPPVVSIPTVPESWSLPLLHVSCGICHVSTLLANVRTVSPDGIASSWLFPYVIFFTQLYNLYSSWRRMSLFPKNCFILTLLCNVGKTQLGLLYVHHASSARVF